MTTAADREMVDYLQNMSGLIRKHGRNLHYPGTTISSVEELVLKYGKPYASKPLSAEAKNIAVIARRSIAPRLKDCYRVATHFVWDWHKQGAVYVEGYASSGILAVSHAWVTMEDAVIDLTWRRDRHGKANPHGQQFVYGQFPPEYAYYGVEIPWDMLMPSLQRRKTYGFLYDAENMRALAEHYGKGR